MIRLDSSSPMPLWAQLEQDLRQRLDRDEFDERFPTDSELVEQYGVSRHTVREAIRHLNRSGILRRERGRGTVVTRTEFEQPLGALYSLFTSVESTGVEQHSDVLAHAAVTDRDAATRLGVAADAELYHLARLRYAGEEPLALDRAWLPMAVAGPLLRIDFTHTSLYDELDRCCGVQPDAGWERIAPIVPPPAERKLLTMRRSEAAFYLERFSTSDGEPLEWRTTTIRGDRYRFMATFEAGGATSLVAQPPPPEPRS